MTPHCPPKGHNAVVKNTCIVKKCHVQSENNGMEGYAFNWQTWRGIDLRARSVEKFMSLSSIGTALHHELDRQQDVRQGQHASGIWPRNNPSSAFADEVLARLLAPVFKS